MSLLNLILLSSTPVLGLGALLGIDRFEKWALDGNRSVGAAEAEELIPEPATVAAPTELQPRPVHRAAA